MRLNNQMVAAQQLNSAIWMFAFDFDPVAVRTVAGAASEIYRRKLKQGEVNKAIAASIRPEKVNDFIKIINKNYNFFKHGENRFEEEYVDYDEGEVEWVLYEACEANQRGPEEYKLECAKYFMHFFALKHPDLLIEGDYKNSVLSLLADDKDNYHKTKHFLQDMIKKLKTPLGIYSKTNYFHES